MRPAGDAKDAPATGTPPVPRATTASASVDGPTDCDVLIAGAGLVGLALAPALAQLGLKVVLADRAPIAMPAFPAGDGDWDTRVYAISPGSALFLRAIGAWQALPPERIAPVETMRITGDGGATLAFSAYDLGERALAWIVEERALRAALLPRVHAAGVSLCAPQTFASLTWSADRGVLHFAEGASMSSRLVVAADGLHSWVRGAAGFAAAIKPYGQTAVVANFTCAEPHHGCARQWFLADGGILAWLPLPGRRISIVWSAPRALADELLALDGPALAARVADAGENALGALARLTPAAGFPLTFMKVPAAIAHRIALIGDAAHGIHPLAGQGVNLGFGDAETLTTVLRERGPVADAGAPALLERYARRRVEPVRAMQTVTDGLVHLFGVTDPWAKALRNLGMSAVNRLPIAKRLLAQSALH
jgi:ubiquinone biosynthesis UbiH/UbiF/VisC/COQ6 family hydroxylase